MDADDNGLITFKEVSSLKRHGQASRHRKFNREHRKNDPAFEEKRAALKEKIKASLKERGHRRFQEVDMDKDGKLSKKEFDDTRKRRFNIMDTTADGRVSLDEFIVHLKTRKSAMGRKD